MCHSHVAFRKVFGRELHDPLGGLPVMAQSDWRLQGNHIEHLDHGVWRSAVAVEITEAASGAESHEIRAATGLKFTDLVAIPAISISGGLPDHVRAHVVLRFGRRLIRVIPEAVDGLIIEKRWLPIDAQCLELCRLLLKNHGAEPSGALSLGNYLALISDPNAAPLLIDETTPWSHVESSETTRVIAPMPVIAIDLYPFQKAGVEFLREMARRDVGALLADQMGLGKTAQVIALLLDQVAHGPSLVVAPASLLVNWKREIEALAPTLAISSHGGSNRTGIMAGFDGFDVVITSYETLSNDLVFMGDVSWNIAVLDEAQFIRNPDSQRAIAVKALNRRVSIAVTGTPVENRLIDLWSIAEFVLPSLLGSREQFELAFPDEFDRAQRLGEIVAPLTLRRLVADVATDLPSLIQEETALDLLPVDRARYDEILNTSKTVFAATTRLRVLCAHANESDEWDGEQVLPPKIERVLSILEEIFARHEKAIIFASFTSTLDRLYDEIAQRHSSAFLGIIDGRNSSGHRQVIIDKFMNFAGSGVLFLNPQAGGVGLNITAANHVIHFNPEWNPAVTSQATARAFRRKQQLPVVVHHLFYVGTVEEDAIARAEWKKELASGVDDGVISRERGQL